MDFARHGRRTAPELILKNGGAASQLLAPSSCLLIARFACRPSLNPQRRRRIFLLILNR
jgi:hypothetical protein